MYNYTYCLRDLGSTLQASGTKSFFCHSQMVLNTNNQSDDFCLAWSEDQPKPMRIRQYLEGAATEQGKGTRWASEKQIYSASRKYMEKHNYTETVCAVRRTKVS